MRQFAVALLVYQQQGIVVLTKSGGANVAHQQRHTLAQTLRSGMGQQIVAFSGKAYAVQRPRLGAGRLGHAGQDVGVLHKIQRRGLTRAILLDFFGGLACHAPVCDGRSCYE